MEKHKKGKGSRYVNCKGFKKLLAFKECKDKSKASKVEYEVKQLSKGEKPDWFDC